MTVQDRISCPKRLFLESCFSLSDSWGKTHSVYRRSKWYQYSTMQSLKYHMLYIPFNHISLHSSSAGYKTPILSRGYDRRARLFKNWRSTSRRSSERRITHRINSRLYGMSTERIQVIRLIVNKVTAYFLQSFQAHSQMSREGYGKHFEKSTFLKSLA